MKKQRDTLTGTPVQYITIYCSRPATNVTSVKMILQQLVVLWYLDLVFFFSFLLYSVVFEYLTGVRVIVSNSSLRGMPLVLPPVLHLLLE